MSCVQRACGGATVTRPASSIVQTATRVWGKLERVCAAQATGESPAKTVSVVSDELIKNDLKTRSLYALSNISPTVSLRMQNGYVRWPVQYDVSVLRPIIPLPSCDRRVWLSTWIHWAKLWPRWAFSLISSHHKKPLIFHLQVSAGHLAGSFLWLQFVQLATLENSALKCVFPVPTTPRATTGTVTVNVYQAGPLSTAPNVSATGFHAEMRAWTVRCFWFV